MAKVKSVLLALGALLLAVSLMAVSITLYNIHIESEEKIIGIGKLERLDELDKSIQDGLRIILRKKWGINISMNQENRTITFNENLSNPVRNIGALGSSAPIADYEDFVEGKFNVSPKVNISDYVLNRAYSSLVIFVKPHMAVYKHNTAANEVTFTPEKQEHIAKCGDPCTRNGYKVILIVNEALPVGTFIDAPSTCTGATCLRVVIVVKNIFGQTMGTDPMVVDPDGSTTAKINFNNKPGAVEIKITNPAKLTVKEAVLTADIRHVSINATFSNVGYPYEQLSATLEENLINIYLEGLQAVKTSTVAFG